MECGDSKGVGDLVGGFNRDHTRLASQSAHTRPRRLRQGTCYGGCKREIVNTGQQCWC